MTLPRSTGEYRIIRPSELTQEQRDVLRCVSRKRVVEQLCNLLSDGRVSASQVKAKYGALMSMVGKS